MPILTIRYHILDDESMPIDSVAILLQLSPVAKGESSDIIRTGLMNSNQNYFRHFHCNKMKRITVIPKKINWISGSWNNL